MFIVRILVNLKNIINALIAFHSLSPQRKNVIDLNKSNYLEINYQNYSEHTFSIHECYFLIPNPEYIPKNYGYCTVKLKACNID